LGEAQHSGKQYGTEISTRIAGRKFALACHWGFPQNGGA
jgi:hypothetical protein